MWSTVELGRDVTGTGEMRCHGDLVLVAVEILMKAGGLVSGTSGPQRDQQHPALRALWTEVIMCRGTATSWVCVCVCDWIHMCSSSSCNKAVHLQCDSMFSDHGRSWVQGGSPSDASAAAQRNFKHLSHQCISLLQRFYSPQRCVCMCVCRSEHKQVHLELVFKAQSRGTVAGSDTFSFPSTSPSTTARNMLFTNHQAPLQDNSQIIHLI